MVTRAFAVCVALLFLCVVPMQAQGPPRTKAETSFSGVSIFLDQDFLFPWTNEDRNYTMGFGLATSGEWISHLAIIQRKLLGWLEPGEANTLLTRHDASIIGNAFSPDSLDALDPIVGDRPYASIVGLSIRRLIVPAVRVAPPGPARRYPAALRSELVLGTLGLRVAEDVQTAIHQALRDESKGETKPVDPLGWPNQISDGGEPTALLRVSYEHRISDYIPCLFGKTCFGPDLYSRRNFEMTGMAEATAGYYTNVAAGLRARVGSFGSEFWDYDGTPLVTLAQAAGGSVTATWDAFFYGAITGRAVAYNGLLQGQRKANDYELSSGDLNRGILEFQAGVGVAFPVSKYWKITTGYLYSGRTAEIKGPFARTHSWGSTYLGFSRVPRID